MEENIKLLTAKEVSKYFGLHVRTIQRLSKQGKIRAVKLGRQWKFNKEDIEKYLSLGIDFSKEPAKKPEKFNNFTERRTYPRINTDFDCQYLINLPRFKVINNKGIIKNLSTGGVLIVCQDDRIEIGDPINLDFMEMAVEGRVLRVTNTCAAVKFRNVSEETLNTIRKYVG